MGWAANTREGLRPIVDLVYPPRCPVCGDAIADQAGLCSTCWNALEFPGQPACEACGLPLPGPATAGHTHCGTCLASAPDHAGIYAATLYNDASRKLVLNFKHGGKIALAELLGRLMAAQLPAPPTDATDEPPLLVPVPLHRWRLWTRGYNQAALLAKQIARSGKGELLVDGLVRTKRTPSLGGLGKQARKQALAGAIDVRASRKPAISGRDIIVVDDVLTSGATSTACVHALHKAGAKSVRIACFARVFE